MKKLIWFGFLIPLVWLTGCGGNTYKSLEVQYPPVPQTYSKLNLKIISLEGIDKKELEIFRELIISELEKKGFSIVVDADKRLVVEIVNMKKDNRPAKAKKDLYTYNTIVLRVFLKDQERTTEFKEFQEFQESIKNWEDMKQTVAGRIADAVYFTAR